MRHYRKRKRLLNFIKKFKTLSMNFYFNHLRIQFQNQGNPLQDRIRDLELKNLQREKVLFFNTFHVLISK